MANLINKTKTPALKIAFNAVEKLSTEDRQLLRLKFFSNDAVEEMKAFENKIKEYQTPVKIADSEIVAIVKSIRKKRNANV